MTRLFWETLLEEVNTASPWQWAIENGRNGEPARLKTQQRRRMATFDPSTPPSWCLTLHATRHDEEDWIAYVNVGLDGRLDPLARRQLKDFIQDMKVREVEEVLLQAGRR